jgi:KipI family sensor histidine kinase inhibitor
VSRVRLLPYGDAAVLAEVADVDEALALHADLCDQPLAGAVDVVPGERTVLVRFDPALTSADEVSAALSGREVTGGRRTDGSLVTVPVAYDGADLADVADAVGLSVPDLVATHQRLTWRVAFVGFAPGFGYLVPDGDWPDVPRRLDPRTRVPAGSVAVAGRYSGVYPGASPGGWQLLGRTDLRVWDAQREPPALLLPGTRVRFEAVRSGAAP